MVDSLALGFRFVPYMLEYIFLAHCNLYVLSQKCSHKISIHLSLYITKHIHGDMNDDMHILYHFHCFATWVKIVMHITGTDKLYSKTI
jgi:hypothetical protein